ncbi:hypothetical protein V6N13_105599 [Hibiscus sabdariffa]|uniref:Uncharacterized protein n=1 Tax=Hibiscus sabdariffa TaxID=183260 RepID=A0ABR2EY68_9ROSI
MSESNSSVKRHWRCRRRSVLMKKKKKVVGLEVSRRGSVPFRRKVETLKKLVPNKETAVGLDGLLREAAEYIMWLQMRVKVMQIMVEVLTG